MYKGLSEVCGAGCCVGPAVYVEGEMRGVLWARCVGPGGEKRLVVPVLQDVCPGVLLIS